MEIESSTKQQYFGALRRMVEEQKRATAKALAEKGHVGVEVTADHGRAAYDPIHDQQACVPAASRLLKCFTASAVEADARRLEVHDYNASSDLSMVTSARCSRECPNGSTMMFRSTASPPAATTATSSTATVSIAGDSTSKATPDAAYKMFDRMPRRSEWSSDCALSIMVCRALYPVNEELLHPILAPYGVKRLVVNPRATTARGSQYVTAIVEFNSSDAAARAQVALHGKCLFEGCCYLRVKLASPYELVLAAATSTATSPLKISQAMVMSTSATPSVLVAASTCAPTVVLLGSIRDSGDDIHISPTTPTLSTTTGDVVPELASTVVSDEALAVDVSSLTALPPTSSSVECANHDTSVLLSVLTLLAAPVQSTTTSDDVSKLAECTEKCSSVSRHRNNDGLTSPPIKTTAEADLERRPLPWPSFECSQVWNQLWFVSVREKNSGFMSKLMGISSGDDTKSGDVKGWSDLYAIVGYHRVKPTVRCRIIATPIEQDLQSVCRSSIPNDALMDKVSVTFLESIVQLVLSQINFGGEVHVQFHGQLCEIPVYGSVCDSSDTVHAQLHGSRNFEWTIAWLLYYHFSLSGLTNMYVWSRFKLELTLWSCPLLGSLFPFCSVGKACLSDYGAATLQWENAWPAPTLCSASGDKSGQPLFPSQRKWNAHWLELIEDGDLFERIKVVKLRPAWPPPHGMCMTLSMANPPRSPCLHVPVNFMCTVSVLRYLNRGNSVEPRPPWSLLATINGILVTVPEVHTTNIYVELNQFWVATSYGSKSYSYYDSEKQYMADQIIAESATYFCCQLVEWQIPWYIGPCRANSLSNWLQMQSVGGQLRLHVASLLSWGKISPSDSVSVIKHVAEVWILHIPATRIIQCGQSAKHSDSTSLAWKIAWSLDLEYSDSGNNYGQLLLPTTVRSERYFGRRSTVLPPFSPRKMQIGMNCCQGRDPGIWVLLKSCRGNGEQVQAKGGENAETAYHGIDQVHVDCSYYFDNVSVDEGDYHGTLLNYSSFYIDLSGIVQVHVVQWDPGRGRRLGVKPKLKEGGLSATSSMLPLGRTVGCY